MGYLSEQDQKEMKIYDQLKTVIDPELGISITDMGLVYKISSINNKIDIVMTLSSKGCPMGELITNNVREAIEEVYPNDELSIELVWEPKWTPDFINETGKKALGR